MSDTRDTWRSGLIEGLEMVHAVVDDMLRNGEPAWKIGSNVEKLLLAAYEDRLPIQRRRA